jgi:signal transduction histidine kinase
LKNGRFASYTTQFGLSDNMTRAIYEDAEGSIWVGTRNGLNRLKDGKFTVYTVGEGLANNSVLSLYGDAKGGLWVGTRSGLSEFKNGRFTSYTTKDGLSDDTVLAITEAEDGGLWIGTGQGLNLLRNGKFTPYRTMDGLTNDGVWSLWEARDGVLWIGTDGGGLNRWENGKFVAYTSKEGLANDIVLSIYEDEEDTIWVGTSGGLSRFKNGRFTTYTSQVGLFDDVVFQILQDGTGHLWMSCNKGVFRVSKKELDDFAEGRVKSITSMSYGTTDGMKSRECNGGFQPAGWKSRDGRLWFPTVKGVAVVAPDRIRINDHVPPVIIERVVVDNTPINATENIRFASGKERFEFHFAGLSYVAPEKVQFKYKLEGFDGDWIDAGTRRDASYTNIPAGHYSFKVIASNNDLVWNLNGASFEFYLQPHFYQTYWFYAFCVVIAGLLGWLLYRFRVRQMNAEFSAVLAERTRLAREIHDTLAQGFVGIALQLEAASGELMQSPESAQQRLKMAHKMVRSSLVEARRSVWDLRAQALERGNLVSALSQIAQQSTAGTSVQAEVKLQGKPRRLPDRVESNLLRIGQEALSNALTHARPTRVVIELSFDRSLIRLCVTDDGCGFESQTPFSASSGHFGLIGIQERVDQIGGQLDMRSSPGNGTKVDVSVAVD